VLVADAARERAERVLAACLAAGLDVRCAGSGPAALEAALADTPQLVIAALDLPLIDGLRLSEILRANPRTADVRFLFLGRATTRPPSPFDETLPAGTPADQITVQALSMLARQSRMDAVRRESAARRELEGQLAQVPLVDLIEGLHGSRRSGVIELARTASGAKREGGQLWLEDGELVHATVGDGVSGAKALFRMLGWPDGRFSFAAERRAPARSLTGPTRVLLLEGLRQRSELANDASLLSRDAEVRLAVAKSEIPSAVHPVTQEVLLLLEMYERVGDIVEHCSQPDYPVLRTLSSLIERGLVVVSRGRPRRAAHETGWLEPDAARRLQEWLQRSCPEERAPQSAKLLLAAPDFEAARDLLRMLAPLPGFEPAPETELTGLGTEDLMRLARLRIGETLSLDLVHVPISEALAPAWGTIAQGALGTLLVCTHPLPDAEARLRPFVDALGRDPNARLFHVLLLRKGDRLEAGELEARLARLDRSSWFLLPLEDGKDRFSLLATMLARVLP
jgi:CheY-like chemotaxis protein